MISFVIPVLNEEESLVAFYAELKKVIPRLTKKYEIIFVDDGSQDNSLPILKRLAAEDTAIRIFSFRKNMGKAEALTYGFMKAMGDTIVTLDADLQDKPTEIYKLLQKQKEGFDVVSGWRKDRKDTSRMVFISRFFNLLMGKFFGLQLHDYNCGLKLYSSEAAKSLRLYGGLHRFIPVLAYQQGFLVDEVVVEHQPRKYGKSKYSFSKLWKDLPDMFTMFFLVKYSKRPLHFFGVIGAILAAIGISFISYLTFIHYVFGATVGRRPLLFMGMLFVIAGLQVFFSGFLADLMINIAHSPQMLDEKSTHYPVKYSSDKGSSK